MTSVVTSIHNFKQESLFRIKACRYVAFCEAGSSLCPLHLSRELYKSPLFMQNKPNVKDAHINVNSYIKNKYEKLDTWLSGKNKPNSNPNKPNLRKAKMNVNLYFIEDYRKKDDFLVRINKPNSNPISSKPKMNANLYFIEDYENETALRPQKNKPKTNPITACPERIEFTLSVIEGNGPILKRMNLNFCDPVATAENCMYHISSLEVTIGDD